MKIKIRKLTSEEEMKVKVMNMLCEVALKTAGYSRYWDFNEQLEVLRKTLKKVSTENIWR